MSEINPWYIVKTPEGHCQIVNLDNDQVRDLPEKWGPYASQTDAIARRVGLIRAGKCQPL